MHFLSTHLFQQLQLVVQIGVMSETRRWLVRTKDMERRERERKAIRMAEEEYKQLEKEYEKLKESNRHLVATVKGLTGAFLVVGGVVLAARLWNGGNPIGGLINHTVGVNIITGEKLLQGIVGKVL